MKKKTLSVKYKYLSFFIVLNLLLSCKNVSMDNVVEDYNKNFIPSEDVFWTIENVEKSTKDFDSFLLEQEYTISADTGLFIIGGPRDCEKYVWVLNGIIVSANQVLELQVTKTITNLSNGNTEKIDCFAVYGTPPYTLILQAEKNGRSKMFKTTIKKE